MTPMNDNLYYLICATVIVVCIIYVYNHRFVQRCECDSKCTGSNDGKCGCDDRCKCGCKTNKSETEQESETLVEKFFGGYRYPYDYPYYWPYFYSGCNETMFGDVKCLPMYMNPFW
jgi:hypothetical protein